MARAIYVGLIGRLKGKTALAQIGRDLDFGWHEFRRFDFT